MKINSNLAPIAFPNKRGCKTSSNSALDQKINNLAKRALNNATHIVQELQRSLDQLRAMMLSQQLKNLKAFSKAHRKLMTIFMLMDLSDEELLILQMQINLEEETSVNVEESVDFMVTNMLVLSLLNIC